MRMRFSGVAAFLWLTAFVQAAPAQERWAGIDPNSEQNSPVVWDSTEKGVTQKAIEACEKISKTCANGPAVTSNMDMIFSSMCCMQPRLGCAIGGGLTKQDSRKVVEKIFADASFSQCTFYRYISARTGQTLE